MNLFVSMLSYIIIEGLMWIPLVHFEMKLVKRTRVNSVKFGLCILMIMRNL